MAEIRKEETFDGRCTVYIGAGVVIADLSREEADSIVQIYRHLERAARG